MKLLTYGAYRYSFGHFSSCRTPRTPSVNSKVLSEHKHKSQPVLPDIRGYLNPGEKILHEIVAYPKHLVYAGGMEMSLEELKAVKYRRKKEEALMQGSHSDSLIPAI